MPVAGAGGWSCCPAFPTALLSAEGLVWELSLEVILPKGSSPAGRTEAFASALRIWKWKQIKETECYYSIYNAFSLLIHISVWVLLWLAQI